MVKCNFCGKTIPDGTGKLFAKKDGSISYFCSNKCEKNLLILKRKPVKTRWTEAFNKLKQNLKVTKTSEKKDTKETKNNETIKSNEKIKSNKKVVKATKNNTKKE